MAIEKKRRSGRSIGAEPAKRSDHGLDVPEEWLPKLVHRPMRIPGDRDVPIEEILRRAREKD